MSFLVLYKGKCAGSLEHFFKYQGLLSFKGLPKPSFKGFPKLKFLDPPLVTKDISVEQEDPRRVGQPYLSLKTASEQGLDSRKTLHSPH